MKEFYYTFVDLSLGRVALVWQLTDRPRLLRLILPDGHDSQLPVRLSFPDATYCLHPEIDSIVRSLEIYDTGKKIKFSFAGLNMDGQGEFCRKVWRETFGIPVGKVSTYGNVAKRISSAGAARAVGTALSRNPFPLIVPCHRVIRANREMGNFSSGGSAMKKRLLEKEGVAFDENGRVLSEHII